MTAIARRPDDSVSANSPLGRQMRRFTAMSGVTLLAIVVASAFLMPLLFMTSTAFKEKIQLTTRRGAALPGRPGDVRLPGRRLRGLRRPDCRTAPRRPGRCVEPHREDSIFIDPANADAGPITWVGRWRTLQQHWTFDLTLGQLRHRLGRHRLPAAAVQHVRDRGDRDDRRGRCPRSAWPTASAASASRGRNGLFLLLLATIILPLQVTLIPTFAVFSALGWVGTWLPLIVPHFFANAYNVFLLRQYFLTIPRDLDEAAMIDGAGPVPDPAVGDRPAGAGGDRGGQPVPLLLGVERLLPAADLPPGQPRAAAAVGRHRRVQRALRPGADAHPGRRRSWRWPCRSSSSSWPSARSCAAW